MSGFDIAMRKGFLGVKTGLSCLVIWMLLVGCTSEFEQVLAECEEQFPAYIEQINEINEEWEDAFEVAASTSRIALSGPVGELQAIQREASDLEPPDCLADDHEGYLVGMETFIGLFLGFMADPDFEPADLDISIASLQMAWVPEIIDMFEEDPESLFSEMRGAMETVTAEAEAEQEEVAASVEAQLAVAMTGTAAPQPSSTFTPVSTKTAVPTDTPIPTDTPTPAPTDTPTPTRVALADLDLEPLLIQPGDLPTHLLPDFVSEELASQSLRLRSLPRPDNFINQRFYNAQDSAGGAVIIFLYESIDTVKSSYGATEGKMKANFFASHFPFDLNLENEEDAFGYMDTPPAPQWHLAFTRCHAFVYVWMTDGREYDIVTYAQKLDERLKPLVC